MERRVCKQKIVELEQFSKLDLIQKQKTSGFEMAAKILLFFMRLLKIRTGGRILLESWSMVFC